MRLNSTHSCFNTLLPGHCFPLPPSHGMGFPTHSSPESHLLQHHPGAGQSTVPVVELLNDWHFQLDAVNCSENTPVSVKHRTCQCRQEWGFHSWHCPALKHSLSSALWLWKLESMFLCDWQVFLSFWGGCSFGTYVQLSVWLNLVLLHCSIPGLLCCKIHPLLLWKFHVILDGVTSHQPTLRSCIPS